MAAYTPTSPYYNTGYTQFYLDAMRNRPIPNTAALWWVFYQRNPNTLTAPPLDFQVGVQIYLPKISTLRSALGF